MNLFLAMLPTILLTVYGQLMIKWRVGVLQARMPEATSGSGRAMHYLMDPLILSAFFGAFLAAVAWLYVCEKYPVSIAFPTYTGILFAFVTVGSAVLLKEVISLQHLIGILVILLGVVIVSRAA
jgi:multidrug transporter EmrE-like cation transporter